MTAPDVNADVRARLLPCPFCGSTDAEVYPADRERTRWNVCCGNPGCVTRGDNDYWMESDAIAAWNRRAALADLAGEVRESYTPFPQMPSGLVIDPKLGPLFDRMQMQSYAMKFLGAALAKFHPTHQEKP